ncbi:MAG: hypothetical protein ACC682_16550, partial [Gemmatimonadota bacterium]
RVHPLTPITVPESCLEGDKWRLLLLRTAVDLGANVDDPLGDYTVPESGDFANNRLYLVDWIPVSVDDPSIAVGPMAIDHDFRQGSGQEPLPDTDWTVSNIGRSELHFRLRTDIFPFDGEIPEGAEPFMRWVAASGTVVTGVMIRCQRNGGGGNLYAGTAETVPANLEVDYPVMGSSRTQQAWQKNQYITFVWKSDGKEPFGSLFIDPFHKNGVGELADQLFGGNSSDPGSSVFLGYNKEVGYPWCQDPCWYNDSPKYRLDSLRVWTEAAPLWDSVPIAIMYLDPDDGQWYSLPAQVAPMSEWTLGLALEGATGHTIDPTTVTGSRDQSEGGQPVGMLGTQVTVQGQLTIVRLEDSGGTTTWIAPSSGTVTFSLDAAVGDDFPNNNTLEYTVSIGCASTLVLPTSVK